MEETENFHTPNPEFQIRVAKKAEGNAFMHHIGFRITHISSGRVEGELELKAFHKQQFGRLHGGVITSISDIVAGFAVYTLVPADIDVVTGEIKISYFRPGFGQKVLAIGKVIKPGKTISFAEAEIFTEKDGVRTLIAKASTSMVLISLIQ